MWKHTAQEKVTREALPAAAAGDNEVTRRRKPFSSAADVQCALKRETNWRPKTLEKLKELRDEIGSQHKLPLYIYPLVLCTLNSKNSSINFFIHFLVFFPINTSLIPYNFFIHHHSSSKKCLIFFTDAESSVGSPAPIPSHGYQYHAEHRNTKIKGSLRYLMGYMIQTYYINTCRK